MGKSFLRLVFNRILHLLARNAPGSTSLRPLLHRMRGVRLGKNVFIGDDVYLENEYPERVTIMDNTIISTRSMILCNTRGSGQVIIGPDVLIGPGAMLICPTKKTLSIGAGAVITNGSLVTSSVAPQLLIAPPRSVAIGRATVPWCKSATIEQFVLGIRPLRPTDKGPGPAAAPPAESSQQGPAKPGT